MQVFASFFEFFGRKFCLMGYDVSFLDFIIFDIVACLAGFLIGSFFRRGD